MNDLKYIKSYILNSSGGRGPFGLGMDLMFATRVKKRVVSVEKGNKLSIRLCKGCLLPLSDRRAHVAAGPHTSHRARTRRW